jgi:hypothetical protein
MTRSVALRTAVLFVAFAALFTVTGLASGIRLAEVLFLIALSLGVLMIGFVTVVPAPVPIPLRAHRQR